MLIYLLLSSILGCAKVTPVVKLDNLHIHGVQVPDSTGALCNAYIGIPYAQPPIGELRWADPKPLQPPKHTQILLAQVPPSQCSQILPAEKIHVDVYEFMYMAAFEYSGNISFDARSSSTSEDCLYLDVFTPNNGGTKKPVMVWIHGGNFAGGSASGYDGRALAISQDVVVVSIQYRLSVFGFLTAEDSTGNWGLKDQTMALRWVQRHISAFGGDASRVTIFGESAGGVSCGMHTVTAYSEGLFQNAILQSGTEYMRLVYSHNPVQMSQLLGQQAGCKDLSSSKLLKCLRQKSQDEIFAAIQRVSKDAAEKVKAGLLYPGQDFALTTYYPTYGNDFFPVHPSMSTHTNKVNLIVGFNAAEVGYVMSGVFGIAEPLTAEALVSKLEFVSQVLAQGNPDYVSKFVDLLKPVYTSSEDSHANMLTAQRVMGDTIFVGNAFIKANKHTTSGNKVYMYNLLRGLTVFQDPSLLDALLVNGSGLMAKPAHVGADHGDDVPFVWGFPFNPNFEAKGYKTTEGDKLLSGLMMKFWGEFARTGSIRGWPEYSSSRRTLMQFDRAEPYSRIVHDPTPEMVNLWTKNIPALLEEMVISKQATQAKQDL